ncbi:MAG: alcohol dehydrogenase (cytochrome c) [Candidatus Azotimanducaceae bacterium]|jgi:alcohol dehydrogenase (cytochrome c)
MTPQRCITFMTVLAVTLWTSHGLAETASFSSAQAESGEQKYAEHCSACHGADLQGIHLSPALVGSRFDQSWRDKPLTVLSFHIQRMPVSAPNSLSEETYTNILAFILKSNGLAPGAPLPSDQNLVDSLHIPALEGVETDPYIPVVHSPTQSKLLANLDNVTDALVASPPADDWLRWGNSSSGTNFSSLEQINQENVSRLKPAWRAPLRSGPSMSAPLVHQGVMYLHSYPDTVLAMDATNGQVLWRYQYTGAPRSSAKMGIGLHGDKILVPTSDLHLLALNAKDGSLIWKHAIDTRTPSSSGRAQYQLRTAPLVVGNKVIQGVTASFMPKGGFILALDIDSGKELWRFNTIARPGEPGGNTWNDLPLEKRSGGSVWHQGTYDAELNLVYFGIAPTYDTGPLLHELDAAGVSNAALYTNCTVAINPDTGELVWFYQHMPNDQWDLDWAFERQIVTLPIDGKPRKVVMNVGKMAILEALDARTGEYLFSIDPGVQNVVTAIDPHTGAKEIDPAKMPSPDRPTTICPSALGARSWPPTSFSAQTGLAYLPLFEMCMILGDEGSALLTSGVRISSAHHPDSKDGKLARLQAIDLVNKRLAWTHDQVAPISTGMLSTAGGLLFSGDVEPSLKAFNDKTGQLLWASDLSEAPTAGLMTYRVNGIQYIAVMVGVANLHVGALSRTYKEFTGRVVTPPRPITERPTPGNAEVWAFALTE